MFYRDSDGVDIIQFGTGDIEVASGILDLVKETIGCLSLIPQKEMSIGSVGERGEVTCGNCLDVCVHTRLLFTKVESIVANTSSSTCL